VVFHILIFYKTPVCVISSMWVPKCYTCVGSPVAKASLTDACYRKFRQVFSLLHTRVTENPDGCSPYHRHVFAAIQTYVYKARLSYGPLQTHVAHL
jgi:hypothetical protein